MLNRGEPKPGINFAPAAGGMMMAGQPPAPPGYGYGYAAPPPAAYGAPMRQGGANLAWVAGGAPRQQGTRQAGWQ
jgi:hypothetical protein